MTATNDLTIVHVTHEAVDHIGGIGTVLAGLIASPVYRAAVGRTILVGPLGWPDSRPADPVQRLGHFGVECLYSGPDHHDPKGLGAILRPVEWAFGVRIVYGTRVFHPPGSGHGAAPEHVDAAQGAEAELLLIDVSNPDPDRLGAAKWHLYEKYGVDSRRYEHSWDYEEWMRISGPAYHALCGLLHCGQRPAAVIAHEFMGLATALRCADDRLRFRTVFHAHECATGRRLVEGLPGHDAAFYPALRKGMAQGKYVTEVFGDQSDFARHALVSQAHRLDVSLAVGPETGEELQALSKEMHASTVRVAYNGVPAAKVDMEGKKASRRKIEAWLKSVLGYTPDYILTHVTRPVPSKGLWRDAKVCQHLAGHLQKAGKTAAYVLLTCGAPTRSKEQCDGMASRHGWPARHVEGFPDLTGPEGELAAMFQPMGLKTKGAAQAMAAVVVNQFGWSRERLGDAAPEGTTFDDLRRAADAEFGLSIYEPFGISPLEPLHAGAIALISSVSGCLGLVRRAAAELKINPDDCPLIMAADFTHAADPRGDRPLADLVAMRSDELSAVEEPICAALAERLFARLPRSEADVRAYLELGQKLAGRMSWDVVAETDFLPGIREAMSR